MSTGVVTDPLGKEVVLQVECVSSSCKDHELLLGYGTWEGCVTEYAMFFPE